MIERSTACVPLVSERAGLAHVQQATRVTRTVTDKKTGQVKTGQRIFLSSIPWESGAAASGRIGRLVRANRPEKTQRRSGLNTQAMTMDVQVRSRGLEVQA